MTGRPDDHSSDQQQATDEGRPADDEPPRSTDGAGASWRDRPSNRRRDHPTAGRPSSSVPAPTVRFLGTAGRIVTDAVTLGLWVIFLTLLFLETSWPRWGFYGLLLGGAALYVAVTAPWLRARN